MLPLLLSRPGLRSVTLLEEMQQRHPDRDWNRLRRTLERVGWSFTLRVAAYNLIRLPKLLAAPA